MAGFSKGKQMFNFIRNLFFPVKRLEDPRMDAAIAHTAEVLAKAVPHVFGDRPIRIMTEDGKTTYLNKE